MNFLQLWRSAAALILCAVAVPVWALDGSVPAIGGDVSRSLLGDGTGVIVGIVDSGVDDTHPALTGLDSLGNPRMVAEANFVTTEPANTGDDVFGHGTWVSSVVLSRGATFTGMAPDARYVNARVLDSNAGFPNDTPVRNGIGFAIDHGADILNLSLNYFSANNTGFSPLDLMIDWAAYARGISTSIAAGNISGGSGTQSVRGPGSAFSGITAGRTIANFSAVSTDSAGAFTGDGRMKPDVVAPGTALTLANDDWEGGAPDWDSNLNGTSFAAPHVAGLMAQIIDAGRTHGLSTDPLVVKAAIMNSADKSVLDRNLNPWQQSNVTTLAGVTTVTQPLDTHSGAGQIDGPAAAEQYLAGEMAPGFVGSVGWDLHSVAAGQFVDYVIQPSLIAGSTLSATLTWYRHVGRVDNNNGIIDAGDSFFLEQALSDLNLQVFRNGNLIAQSISAVDNVEHLLLEIDRSARYKLRVFGSNVIGAPERFALAWHGVLAPEPSTFLLIWLAIACCSLPGQRRRSAGAAA